MMKIEFEDKDLEPCTLEMLSEIHSNMQRHNNSARVSLIPWCGYDGKGFDLKRYVWARGIARLKRGMS